MKSRRVSVLAVSALAGLALLVVLAWSMRDRLNGAVGDDTGGGELHQCLGAAEPLYTNRPCPAGTRAAPAGGGRGGGTLSVVPAYQAPPATVAAASRAHLRELLAPSDGADLRERQMERVISGR